MMVKKKLKFNLKQAIFGFFFAIMGSFTLGLLPAMTEPVYADPSDAGQTSQTTMSGATEAVTGDACKKELGEIAWLVCPSTGKIAEATDWLYEKIEDVLVISPASMEDGSPIYEIWKYCRGITNVVFIIFLLVVVYSQITGLGINNYGIKKALPKLIIAAVLVNLSFYVCTLAVDLSNVIGNGLRGVFASVAESTMAGSAVTPVEQLEGAAWWDHQRYQVQMENTLYGGALLATFAGLSSLGSGAIWMLIPVVLGGIVAVASGLITIALRQAVVTILMMIAPLAMVAYMLPNTEQWFKKWKDLLFKMLVFYPMFSLLFGASNLAGFAIIRSAKEGDGFVVLLGTAVQIFPLFFSWSLMKMSGTFLGTINTKIRGLAARPLATNRAWAESRRQLTRARHLERNRMPSAWLMNYMNNRKVAREVEVEKLSSDMKQQGLAYYANSHYEIDSEGNIVGIKRKGKRAYAALGKTMQYGRAIQRHTNNFDEGLKRYGRNAAEKAELAKMDMRNGLASDYMEAEKTRGVLIKYRNEVSRHERLSNVVDWHLDEKYGYEIDENGNRVVDENGNRVWKEDYRPRFDGDSAAKKLAHDQYKEIAKIMHGKDYDIQYVAANAAHARDTQQKIHDNAMRKYAELTPPTKRVEFALDELIRSSDKFENTNAIKNVDALIAYMRVLNQRGDTDIVAEAMDKIMTEFDLVAGTNAAQALSNFSMFEVKGADPFIRRFGKYINLETAQIYNKNKRKNPIINFKEYVTGQYEEDDPDNPGQKIIRYSKSSLVDLMEGTSFDDIERTAMSGGDTIIKKAYRDEDGKLDVKKFFAKRKQVEDAIGPQFISSSLKQLSGSEQLKSLVTFKTGYLRRMAKYEDEHGKEHVVLDDKGNPEYEWHAVWDDDKGDFVDNKNYAREHYRKSTMKYVLDQTPNQILKFRSDYYDGLREHLVSTFEQHNEKDLTDEQLQAKREYEAERARIQTEYGDAPNGEAKRKRDEELKAAKHKLAGVQFRKMLDERGTLGQIYRMRRSGIAADAKPWVREWLGLDDEGMIKAYEYKKWQESSARQNEYEAQIDQIKRGRDLQGVREEQQDDGDNVVFTGDNGAMVYTEQDKQEYINHIGMLYDDLNDDDESFYKEALAYLKEVLSENSYITTTFEQLHKDNRYADSYAMRDWLFGLLDDLSNY